jgi:hypothetical protein
MDISSAVHSPRSLKFAISNKDGTCRLGFHDAATLKPPPYGLAVLTFRRPETAVGHHLNCCTLSTTSALAVRRRPFCVHDSPRKGRPFSPVVHSSQPKRTRHAASSNTGGVRCDNELRQVGEWVHFAHFILEDVEAGSSQAAGQPGIRRRGGFRSSMPLGAAMSANAHRTISPNLGTSETPVGMPQRKENFA